MEKQFLNYFFEKYASPIVVPDSEQKGLFRLMMTSPEVGPVLSKMLPALLCDFKKSTPRSASHLRPTRSAPPINKKLLAAAVERLTERLKRQREEKQDDMRQWTDLLREIEQRRHRLHAQEIYRQGTEKFNIRYLSEPRTYPVSVGRKSFRCQDGDA